MKQEDQENEAMPYNEEIEVGQAPPPQRIEDTMQYEQPDGSLDVDLEPDIHANRKSKSNKHFENLVDDIEESELKILASTLLEAIDGDERANEGWNDTVAAGMKELGIGISTDSEILMFPQASTIFSSAFMESLLNLQAIARAELLPPKGPADMEILGEIDEQKEDKASRWKEFANFYLTEEYQGFYNETEKALNWAILAGSGFQKTYIDPNTNKIRCPCINPDDIIINPTATSLVDSSRITHRFYMNSKDFRMMQMSGFYRDVKVQRQENDDNQNPIAEKLRKMDGKDSIDYEYEGIYELYEIHANINIESIQRRDLFGKEGGLPLPFIVTVEKESQTVLRLVRNWEEEDPTFKRIEVFTHHQMVPGFDIYGWGLSQIAVNSAKAATALTRQVIDAGTLSNFPGGLRAKGIRLTDNNKRIGPLEFIEIDLGGMDDISKAIMPMPYKDPSMVTKQIKDDIETNIRNLVGAASLPLADFNTNAPVGTTLAILEQVNRNQSSIMRRFHQSMSGLLKLIFKLFPDMLPDEPYPFKVRGKSHILMKKDFSGDFSIIPVSDPNLNSSSLRLVRVEALRNIAKEQPELFDMYEVNKRMLRELKIDDIDKVLPPKEKDEPVPTLDPISENMRAMQGEPIEAHIFEDHEAHITVHQSWMTQQQEQNPEGDLSAMNAHVTQHNTFMYQLQMQQMIGQELPEDPSQLPREMQNQIAQQAADTLQQQKQTAQEGQPQPIDPAAVMMKDVEVKDKGIDVRAEIDMMKIENEKVRLELEMFKAQSKDEIDRMKAEHEFEIKKAELLAKGIDLQAPQVLEELNTPDIPDSSEEQPQG
jgi:hypothetical protein